jgi:hypothetical protein
VNWPREREGSSGENVRSVQYLLDADGATLTVDGNFGPATKSAVESFQTGHGLVVDGIVGDQTWPALIIEVSSGSSGDAVRAVQSQIHSRSDWLTVDGSFGPETESAVRFFQGDIGLTVDGIVGPHTWNALVSGYLLDQGGQSAAAATFHAWEHNDRPAASKQATPAAVNDLFTRTWHASDGWVFDHCEGAAGHFYCTWNRPGGKLVLGGNDNTGAPFYFVDGVTFEP